MSDKPGGLQTGPGERFQDRLRLTSGSIGSTHIGSYATTYYALTRRSLTGGAVQCINRMALGPSGALAVHPH